MKTNLQLSSSLFMSMLLSFLMIPELVAQSDITSYELSYGVHRVYDGFSITPLELEEAETLSDLNEYYPVSAVKEYYSVEIHTLQAGQKMIAIGPDTSLTMEQKTLIGKADYGSSIRVKVFYLPENTLSNNVPKEMEFEFILEAHKPAGYAGGRSRLLDYLGQNGLQELSSSVFRQHHLTAASFTIDDTGQVMNVHMAESSKDDATDSLLIAALCKMPAWNPAEYSDGSRVRQTFVLTVGDHHSCVINLLKIRARTDAYDNLDLVKLN